MKIRERIIEHQFRTWTRAFDSHDGHEVNVRRLDRDPHATWNDRWLIEHPRQYIHSSRGCLPLYITIL